MNLQDIIYSIQTAYENADARNIFEHAAIQFNVSGEVNGTFYIEVAERNICVEPYEYHNPDAIISISSDAVLEFLNEKISTNEALDKKLVTVKGNIDKVRMLQKISQKKDV